MGAGCIAQVYRGELLLEEEEGQGYGTGKLKVAVKLIHPHVRKQIDVVRNFHCCFFTLFDMVFRSVCSLSKGYVYFAQNSRHCGAVVPVP